MTGMIGREALEASAGLSPADASSVDAGGGLTAARQASALVGLGAGDVQGARARTLTGDPPTSPRDRAVELRAAGLKLMEISAALGVSRRTVQRWLNPADEQRCRESSLAYKQRLRGTCERCGAVTRYNGHRGNVSRLCPAHAAVASGETRRGNGPQQKLVREFCQTPRRWSEIRDHFGFDAVGTSARITSFLKRGVLVRVSRGVYVAAETEKQAA